MTWERDQDHPTWTADTVTWTCPSREDEAAAIWTNDGQVVGVTFGPASS